MGTTARTTRGMRRMFEGFDLATLASRASSLNARRHSGQVRAAQLFCTVAQLS
jgi:hypothetical protein